jgi:16S rRNA (uracil1498-N3)-methyltransferase
VPAAGTALALWHNRPPVTSAKPLSRIYFPEDVPEHGRCFLPAAQAHHVARVLRLRGDDRVTLFDGRGNEYEAVIVRVNKEGVTVDVGERRAVDRESPLAITLAQGISSGERMDYTVQKAVELGVAQIQPLETSRAVVRLDSARARKRCAHWQAIAIAACEQCGRNRVPEITPVLALRDWLARRREAVAPELGVLLSPMAEVALGELPAPRQSVCLIAGPEGGLTVEERQDVERAGFIAARLGPRVLRTETAAVAALAAMQTLWGDL